MDGVILTCFTHNVSALKFYVGLGYEESPHSPSNCIVDLKGYATEHLKGARAKMVRPHNNAPFEYTKVCLCARVIFVQVFCLRCLIEYI